MLPAWGCSHFNQLLAACIDHVEYGESETLTVNGRLSREKFTVKFPGMKTLFDEGMDWTVWKKVAEEMYRPCPTAHRGR